MFFSRHPEYRKDAVIVFLAIVSVLAVVVAYVPKPLSGSGLIVALVAVTSFILALLPTIASEGFSKMRGIAPHEVRIIFYITMTSVGILATAYQWLFLANHNDVLGLIGSANMLPVPMPPIVVYNIFVIGYIGRVMRYKLREIAVQQKAA